RRKPRPREVVARRQVERGPSGQLHRVPGVVHVRPPAGITLTDSRERLPAGSRVARLTRDRERLLRVARVHVAGPLRLRREVAEALRAAAAARDADDVLALARSAERRAAVVGANDLQAA